MLQCATQESPLHSTDRLMFTFWGLLSLVFLVLHSRLQFWWVIPAANIAAIVLVWAIARASQVTGFKVLRWVHDWAAFPLIIFTYKQVYYLIRLIHQGKDYDQLLIAMDRALFRVNPTEWLAHFSNPCLTEVLQIAYSLFYAIFLIVGLGTVLRSRFFPVSVFQFHDCLRFLSLLHRIPFPSFRRTEVYTARLFKNRRRTARTARYTCLTLVCQFLRIHPPGVSNSVALAAPSGTFFRADTR